MLRLIIVLMLINASTQASPIKPLMTNEIKNWIRSPSHIVGEPLKMFITIQLLFHMPPFETPRFGVCATKSGFSITMIYQNCASLPPGFENPPARIPLTKPPFPNASKLQC